MAIPARTKTRAAVAGFLPEADRASGAGGMGESGSTFRLIMPDNRFVSTQTLNGVGMASQATPSRAAEMAERNFARNLAAMPPRQRQRLATLELPACEWVFGRDGSLTARVEETWLAGTGLPARVAQTLVASADVSGRALCLVAPTHGQQIRSLLDRCSSSQVLVALLADDVATAWALHCVDVSEPLRDGQLHVVAGPELEAGLVELFETEPGLVVPGTLFRPGDAEGAEVVAMMEAARRGLTAAAELRGEQLEKTAATPARRDGETIVVAPGGFRLWHDAGATLWETIGGEVGAMRRLDGDQPRQASALCLAQAAAGAGAIVASDLLRADLPEVAHRSLPWIAWITSPRPAPAYTGGRDAVLLADPAWRGNWLAAGWPEQHVAVAEWPLAPIAEGSGQDPVLIHDLPSLTPPPAVERYSSQRLLWEHLAEDLMRVPFLLHEAASPAEFLRRRARKTGVGDLPESLFIHGCLLPAYVRGVAIMLCRGGSHCRIFGCGWEAEPGVEGYWGGPVEGREQFEQLCAEASAVVVASPGAFPAMASAGARVILTAGHTEASFLSAVRKVHPAARTAPESPLDAQVVIRLLETLWQAS